jgi:hypothetical protein
MFHIISALARSAAVRRRRSRQRGQLDKPKRQSRSSWRTSTGAWVSSLAHKIRRDGQARSEQDQDR